MIKTLAAEALGTFVWVAAVCGAMLISTASGILGVALCVGLSVAAMMAVFPGGHFNPAVTLGALAAGRVSPGQAGAYVVVQVIGASLAALLFFILLSSTAGYTPVDFAANGYGSHSPGGFSANAVFLVESCLTALLVFIVLALTGSSLAPLIIGGAIAAFHLMSFPIDNTSLNPARSTATALFAEGWAVSQLWLFWIATMLGGVIGGLLSRWLKPDHQLD